MPEARASAPLPPGLHHRHPGQRPARPHAGDGRRAPGPQDAHLLRGQRPGLRRGHAHHQGAPSTTRRRSTRFAGAVEAVTYEFENVPIATAQHLARLVPVRPVGQGAGGGAGPAGRKAVHRRAVGIPVAPFRADRRSGRAERRRSPHFGAPAILKTRRLGYDGKGQASVQPGADIDAAWNAVGATAVRARKAHRLRAARSRRWSCAARRGELAFYDCPVNTHENGILRRSVVPSGLPEADLARARDIAADDCRRARLCRRAGRGDVLSRRRRAARPSALMVNEIAPRVHNSGHWTIEACARQPVREPHARRGRLAAGLDRAPQRRRDGEPDRQGGARLARGSLPSPAPACTSTASARPAPGARWATSPGLSPKR